MYVRAMALQIWHEDGWGGGDSSQLLEREIEYKVLSRIMDYVPT